MRHPNQVRPRATPAAADPLRQHRHPIVPAMHEELPVEPLAVDHRASIAAATADGEVRPLSRGITPRLKSRVRTHGGRRGTFGT